MMKLLIKFSNNILEKIIWVSPTVLKDLWKFVYKKNIVKFEGDSIQYCDNKNLNTLDYNTFIVESDLNLFINLWYTIRFGD